MAMRPAATKADIPSAHDVSTFIHNSFIDFFQRLKINIQVSSILFWVAYSKPHTLQSNAAGRVLTTMDLWSVNKTKAAFFGITAHWIEANTSGQWSLNSQVIAFRGVSGAHDGANLGRYFIGLCECIGIIAAASSKVSTYQTYCYCN